MSNPDQSEKRCYFLLLVACLIVNWPIFFSDVLVNDDLMLVTSNGLERYDGMKEAFLALAKPSGYYFHRMLASFTPDGTFPYRLYNFILIAATSLVFFRVIRHGWILHKDTALVITFGFLCFPSFGIQPFAIGTVHFVSYFLFYSGIWLAYSYWRGDGGIARLLSACLCLGIGMRMSSTIPFLYIFLFSFGLLEWLKRRIRSDLQRYDLVKGLWITLLLTGIMVFTFTIERLFFLQHNWFRGTYNQISLDLGKLLENLARGIDTAFVGHFVTLFEGSAARLLLLALGTAVLLALVVRYRLWTGPGAAEGRATCGFLALMAVLTICFAVFPYAAVDKIPKAEGYQSRWAILTGVGGATSIGLIFELARVARHRLLQWGGYAAIIFLCCGFTLMIWDHYGKWQKVSHDNKAMIAKLKQLEYRPEIDVWCVDTNLKSESFYVRRWYDWAYVFDESWNTYRQVMGFHKTYCQTRGLYQDGRLKSGPQPLIAIIDADVKSMEDLISWMYYGKASAQYNLGSMKILAQDARINDFSGAQMVFEAVKFKWFSSELLRSYYDNIEVSYD